MERSQILSLKANPRPTHQLASCNIKPRGSHRWAAWAGIAASLSLGFSWLGKETVGKSKASPGWGGELGCCWEELYLHSHLPSFTASGHFPHSHNLFPKPMCRGWARSALPAGLGDSSGCPGLLMMTTISPPHYFRLSALLWLEGPGFVKDVSSHIV